MVNIEKKKKRVCIIYEVGGLKLDLKCVIKIVKLKITINIVIRLKSCIIRLSRRKGTIRQN